MSENLFYKFVSVLFPESKEAENTNIISSIDLLQLDPEIRSVVYWLRQNGFETKKSCGGTNPKIEIHVSLDLLISETKRLKDLLLSEHEVNIYLRKSETNLIVPEIEITYNFQDEVGKVFLYNVTDFNLKTTNVS